MDIPRNITRIIQTYFVIAYLVLAFGWWSVLLFTKNEDAFLAKKELLVLVKIAEGEIRSPEEIETLPEYLALKKEYDTQEWMIGGEVIVFIVILSIGLIMIQKSYNKEIEAANQRRNFLLSITHELKSPIASIRLVLETIKKRVLKPEQKEKLILGGLTETERLHQLVNNLLLSARLDATYEPNREIVDLVQLLEEQTETLLRKHPNAQITLDLQENIPLMMGDRIGVTSVLVNLLENAIKYAGGPAKILVDLRWEKQQILLDIADQGIGISDKEKKKIFEKFYRVGSEDTRRTKGTGLGLYIVKQVVQGHQGTIKVKDNIPNGTVFSITFPAKERVTSNGTTVFEPAMD
ncbi:MAG: ATP-binding protein [Bacteroidota bacterium]